LYNGFLGYNLFVALRFIFKALEWTGHGVPWLIYSAYKLLVTKYSKAHLLLMLGLILDLIVIAVFKLIFKRPRPSYNEGDLPLSASKIDSYSFPSGHATRAYMLYIVLPYVGFTLASELQILLWAIILGYSRVGLGRHYISDVIVGALVGIIEGWCTIYLGNIVF